MSKSSKHSAFPANVRVLIAMVASPFLFAYFYMGYLLYVGEAQKISVAVLSFAAVGALAYFVAFTGRLPFRKPSAPTKPEDSNEAQ